MGDSMSETYQQWLDRLRQELPDIREVEAELARRGVPRCPTDEDQE